MRHTRRRGSITVAVLVCLLVITVIAAGLLRQVQSQRALLKDEERRLQAEWLAESGLERAAVRLHDDPAYRGETWAITAGELGGPASGVVSIKIEPIPGGAESNSNQRRVTAQADYPVDPPHRVRTRKQVVVTLGPTRAGAMP
jgi:hypothetical protein